MPFFFAKQIDTLTGTHVHTRTHSDTHRHTHNRFISQLMAAVKRNEWNLNES